MDPGEDPRPGTEKSQQETGNTPAAIGWRRQKSCRDRKNKRGMVARKRCFCGVRDELMSLPDHEWAGMKPSKPDQLVQAKPESRRHDRVANGRGRNALVTRGQPVHRSEEHTSELQSLMRISDSVFCLKTKT